MMYGKTEVQSVVEGSAKNPVEEDKDKIEVTESDCGKIVIQVNLSKQSLHNTEISQIIREIFELSNHDVEVEKVVLPTGENTWQVRKMESASQKEPVDLVTSSVSMDLAEKRQKISRMKLMKHNKLYRIKLPKSLSRPVRGSRRKLSERLSGEFGLSQLDVSEVHSSPAITNLLSQLYPNPYNLISLLEVQNPKGSKGALDASDSCKIKYKAKDALFKESDVEQEFAVFTVPSVPPAKIPDKKVEGFCTGGMGEKKSTEKVGMVKKESALEKDLFKFAGINEAQNNDEGTVKAGCRKVKRMIIGSGETLTGTNDSNPSRDGCLEVSEEDQMEATNGTNSDLTMSVGSDNRKRCKITESKIVKKKVSKTANPTVEKTEGDKTKRNTVKVLPSTGERVCISTIHPMSLQRTNLVAEENKGKINQQTTEKKPTDDKDPKAVLKPMTEKKKCVIQYLKLIKGMYEEEERSLQNMIDNAWNFALDHMENPEKKPVKSSAPRKNQQTALCPGKGQDGKFKHSQSQTPKPKKLGKKKSTPAVQKKRVESAEEAKNILKANPELTIPEIEFTQKKDVKIPEGNTLLLRPAYKETSGPSFSRLDNRQKSSQVGSFNNTSSDFGVCNRKSNTLRTDTFVFRRKTPKKDVSNPDGLPIEVINRNVLETNRKIDLLIRHIDNSMDWLSQSEKTEPSNISSLIEKAKDLSDKLEENLRIPKSGFTTLSEGGKESWKLYENKNLCNRSDLLLAPSYQSLHIFPVDRGIGSVRIRTGAFFNNDLTSTRTRDCLRFPPETIQHSSLSNLMLPHSRSVNHLASNRQIENSIILAAESGRSLESRRVESEVPELRTATEPMLIVVENTNEHGSFVEDINRRNHHGRSLSETRRNCTGLAGITATSNGNIYRVDSGKSSPSSLSISVIALDESSSSLKPVIMQEITWSFPVPAPSPVTRMHYRNERHMVFTTIEANVLHVARATSFMDLALMSVAQVVEQEPKQQSSVIISLHKCSSFVKNNDGLDESSKVCKFVVLPSDLNFTERTSVIWDEEIPGMDIKILKCAESARKERGPCAWDPFPSESSMEMYDGDKATVGRMATLLKRSNKPDRYGKNLTWIHPVPDPYESNPADEDTETTSMKQTNFHAIRSGPQQSATRELFPNEWVRRKLKFDAAAPPIFRYLSSETSNTSLDDKEGDTALDAINKGDHPRKISKLSSTNISHFPDINKSGENTNKLTEQQEAKTDFKNEDDDSSSTSSFKSSNDFSDISELPELSYPKKRPKSRSHFLDKLFHELRSFRKCLTRRRGPKRKTAQDEPNEFEDALSELNVDIQQENKLLVSDDKRTADEAVAVNTMCIDEVGGNAMPRKIFKTSFRGKESVTELMIDLKDMSISEVSDISVEKRKLSTDHTKISIIISKQAEENAAICCTNQGYRKGERGLSREGSYHSLKDTNKTNCLGWKKDASKSDDDADEDDYKSADSGTQTRSLENIPGKNTEEDTDFRTKMLIRDSLIEPRRRSRSFGRHKFDFYKKMENGTSFDSLKLDGNELLLGKYDKEIAPLKKALADMQFRVQNIQKNTFWTGDEYYERALRMAKMSAGYCQLCKSKTVIPEDPLGIYQRLIPRTSFRSPYSKNRKYYFKTTSSTNSSFYSIHSSNSDVSDKFCHLNNSSSIVTNGLSRSRGPVLRESTNSNIPLFLGRTLHF